MAVDWGLVKLVLIRLKLITKGKEIRYWHRRE